MNSGAKSRQEMSESKSGEREIKRQVFFDSDFYESESADKKEEKKQKKERPRKRKARRKSGLPAFALKYGKASLFVKGKGGVRALSAIGKICRVSDVAVSEEGVRFFVPAKLLQQIVALLDNLCYDYKILGYSGAAPALARVLARVGLIVGIVIFAALIAAYPSLVTRIDISGVDGALPGALNAEVEQILSSFGIAEGKWLPSFDEDAVSKRLLELEGVAFAGVERHGTHVNVLIKRELAPDRLWEIEGSAVAAKRLATVTRVIVEGGTAQVKYGDVVREGDVVIDGYVLFGEDKLPVEAKGRAYGKVLLKREVFFGDVVLKKSYGAVKRVAKLAFFGKVPKAPNSPYECYELCVTKSEMGFLLPIETYTYEFRELAVVEAEETRSDEQLVAEVYSSLLAELEEQADIAAVYSDVARVEDGRKVSVTIEAEVLIT